MHILTLFKDKRNLTLDEIHEAVPIDLISLSNTLDEYLNKKILRQDGMNYTLKNSYAIGYIDIKSKGFGFLLQKEADIFIGETDLSDALDGDLVLVHLSKNPKVVLVLERLTNSIVVHVKKQNNTYYLVPIKPIRLKIELNEAKTFLGGEVLKLNLIQFEPKKVIAQIDAVLGFETDPGMDILELVYDANWPIEYQKETLEEVDKLEKVYDKNRTKIIDECIVTIDGKDAKDLDDAVSLKKEGNEYILSVHIADVSLYVKENSFLDHDAFSRTTSLYLADRVIPMLPRKLSNDLCSLNAHTEKDTLSCIMRLDAFGNLIDHKILESVIEVNQRLNYDEVNDFLDTGGSLYSKEIEEMITLMNELSLILEEKRTERGALTLNTLEFKYETDELGNIMDIHPYVTGRGQLLIESFMVLANETVSMHLSSLNLPCIYRVHDKPKEEKLLSVFDQLKELGIKTPKLAHITPKTIQNVLKKLEGNPLEEVFHTLFLRAMQKAVYSETNIGHYGLASTYYSHFTSPIRRYPDLLLHRLLKAFLIHPTNLENKIAYYDGIIPAIAEKCSIMEKKADELERETDKLKTSLFMVPFKNQEFDAIVSAVSKAGLFIRLDNGIEGLVPIRLMDDYYYFDELHLTLTGKHSNRVYRIGNKVKVKLIEVDIKLRQLTFLLEEKNHGRKRENHRAK